MPDPVSPEPIARMPGPHQRVPYRIDLRMTTLNVPGVRKPLPVRSIVWIASDNSYAHLYFLNGQHYTITRMLNWFGLQLPDFVRLHKTILVNPVHVIGCQWEQSRSVWITVRTGTSFPVARRRVEFVVKSLHPTKTDLT